MQTIKNLLGATAKGIAAVVILSAATAVAQTAKVHGSVNDATGTLIKKGDVKFTTDKNVSEKDMKFQYSVPIDGNGNYSATDIKPGDYTVFVRQGDLTIDFLSLTVKGGDDKTLNFDMTRDEYMKALSPERRKEIEEFKKKNAEATSTNAKVANLNATLKAVRDDLASAHPNFADDLKKMQDAVAAKPDEGLLYLNLGQVEVASADAAVAQAKLDKRPWQSDEAILKNYNDGIAAYKKGIELNAASKKPAPVDQAIAWNSVGTASAKIGKLAESQEAFEAAVKLNPPGAGMYYGNEAAVLFNAQQGDAAAAAADKAIAVDPTKPDPYYVKGQALIAKTTVGKDGKYVFAPGCLEAYQKYLELAPNGKFAPEIAGILSSMGQTVNTKYKAGKK